jgi:hypothetical protein
VGASSASAGAGGLEGCGLRRCCRAPAGEWQLDSAAADVMAFVMAAPCVGRNSQGPGGKNKCNYRFIVASIISEMHGHDAPLTAHV